jgi:hypothetical protein
MSLALTSTVSLTGLIGNLIDVEVDDIDFYQDDEWHKMMKQSLGLKKYRIEVLGEPPNSIENSFLDKDVLEKLRPKKPIRTDFINKEDIDEEGYYKDIGKVYEMKDHFDPEYGYVKSLWIWEDPIPQMEYGIAADVSTGRAGDYSGFHVFNLHTGEQVASFKDKLGTEKFKQIILYVAQFYNNAKVSVESNSLGEGICQWFTETVKYENFYWTQKSRKNYAPGFYVGANRGNMLATMENAFVGENGESTLIINDLRTINELKSFGFDPKTGKAQAMGGNDDLVMALAQFCFLRINFFSTGKAMLSDLVFSEVLESSRDQQRQKHYFNNDVLFDDKSKELLDLLGNDPNISFDLNELRKSGIIDY